ncbi:MAG: amidase [Actinomycetales bacterium]
MSAGIWESAREIGESVRSGQVSALTWAERALNRSVTIAASLNCFAEIAWEYARSAAERVDAIVRARADPGPLAGVPIAIKDATPVAGLGWRSGSWAYADRVADRDAVVVRRMIDAGAVIVGKTTLPEIAYSSFCDSPLTGTTRNPWMRDRTPGGSSGGSAAAVASGCVTLAEGTDMGGSVRIPAAFTGILGIKPAAGRIPNDDMDSVVDDIAHHGLLARTTDDLALGLSVAYGPDNSDPLSLALPEITDWDLDGVAGLRIGITPDLGFFVVEQYVEAQMAQVAEVLREAGAVVTPAAPAWDRTMADAWVRHWHAYLAAFFGSDLDQVKDQVDPRLWEVIEKGRSLSAVTLKQGEVLRTRQWKALSDFWSDYDILICPTMSRGAVAVGGDDAHYHREATDGRKYGLDLTSMFNWVPWCPVLSVPTGMSPKGLPLGAQIVAPPYRDDLVLSVSRALERAFGVPRPPEP